VGDIVGTNLGVHVATGLADTYVQPVNLAWRFSRADVTAGYGFMAPTGSYSRTSVANIGSGYWGHNVNSGNTFYLTKNGGTTANIFSNWESHRVKSGSNNTPGQAFTMEWGLGQSLPLDKELNKIVQIGFVGYDQWQVTDNSGNLATHVPHYSAHAVGLQTNFIIQNKGLVFFFKYYNEQNAKAHPEGNTFVFGGSWTIRTPKS